MTTHRLPGASRLAVAAILAMLASCATVPAPVDELAEAERAVQAAAAADAEALAPLAFDQARRKLAEATSALHAGQHLQARQLAEQAAVDAEFAEVTAHAEQHERAAAAVQQNIGRPAGSATPHRVGS